jgi:cytochrome c oxidase assembly protein subunit 15
MVEWNLFMGSVPPTTDADWQELFEKYKQYPEYKLVNFNIEMDEFKSIFYWEYGHRMFGRLIGLVFIVPFLWFWIKGNVSKKLMPRLLLILFMGGFQGFLGWYMVKSGLVKEPDVSHYRLAAHLITAFITFAYTFWVALDLLDAKKLQRAHYGINRSLKMLLILVLIQIVWGAYVAGLNAGKVYNSWPKMGEQWIADGVTAMQPFWLNFVEGIAGVQFLHRYLAYLVVGLILYLYFKGKGLDLIKGQKVAMNVLLITVSLQFVLGVFTLLYAVPISLGLFHQLGAFLLLGSVVFAMHKFKLPTIA